MWWLHGDIGIPVARPQDAAVITGARIFTGIAPAPARGGGACPARALAGADRAVMAQMAANGPRNCHDVSAYPAMGLLAGTCASHGLLVDISNPEKPIRLERRPSRPSRCGTLRCSATMAQVDKDATSAHDGDLVRAMAAAIRDLAAVTK